VDGSGFPLSRDWGAEVLNSLNGRDWLETGEAPSVAVVVPARNRVEKTLRFIEAFKKQTYTNYTLFIVDSASTDGTPDQVRQAHPDVVVLLATDDDFWTGATNIGVRAALDAHFDYVLTINDDSVIMETYLEDVVRIAVLYNQPILGCRIDFMAQPGLIWSIGSGHHWGSSSLFDLNYYNVREEELTPLVREAFLLPVESMPGNGVLIARRVFEAIGLYDEENTPHYHADTEFMLRARSRGFMPMVTCQAIVYNDCDLPASGHSLMSLRSALNPRRLIHVADNIHWMFTKKKSHYYFKAYRYIINAYGPKHLRRRSTTAYIGHVVADALGVQNLPLRLCRAILHRVERISPRLGTRLRRFAAERLGLSKGLSAH